MNQKVENLSNAALFIGLGVLAIFNRWWPDLIIVVGIYFALKNGLSKNYLRMIVIGAIFIGVYVSLQYPLVASWNYILPFVLFALGIEKLLKELFLSKKRSK